MSSKTLRASIVVAAAVVAVVVLVWQRSSPDVTIDVTEPPLSPAAWSPPEWDEILGGDSGVDAATWERLDAHTDLGEQAGPVETAAGAVTTARFTGEGVEQWPRVFAEDPFGGDGNLDAQLAGTCENVDVVATSAVELPAAKPRAAQLDADRFAKVAVAWTGTCTGTGAPEDGEVRVTYTYAEHIPGSGWRPTAEGHIPGSGWRWAAHIDEASMGWGTCGGEWQAAADVAAAFDEMCEAAAQDGVELDVTSALRTPEEQAQLYADAVREVGSDRAERWVRPNSDDGVCVSRHCSGDAIDIADNTEALLWLDATAWCAAANAEQVDPDSNGQCPPGTSPVPRHITYGFIRPYPHIPTHLEWGVPRPGSGQQGCNISGAGVPETIAATWRCELARAGLPASLIVDATAQAVAQARCASGWNPAALGSAGRFTDSDDPLTGRPDRRAGVHMIEAAQGERVPLDTAGNARVAAQMWLGSREAGGDGWETFVCAAEARADVTWAYRY